LESLGAAVPIRQDGLRSEIRRDNVQAPGLEQAIGRVLTLEVACDFAAEKAARHRVMGIPAQPAALAVLDVDQQTAGVGTIERANGIANLRQVKIIATGDERNGLWGYGKPKIGTHHVEAVSEYTRLRTRAPAQSGAATT